MYNYYQIIEACKKIVFLYDLFLENEMKYDAINDANQKEKSEIYKDTMKYKKILDKAIMDLHDSFEKWID
jgi:hypothetical protein